MVPIAVTLLKQHHVGDTREVNGKFGADLWSWSPSLCVTGTDSHD